MNIFCFAINQVKFFTYAHETETFFAMNLVLTRINLKKVTNSFVHSVVFFALFNPSQVMGPILALSLCV